MIPTLQMYLPNCTKRETICPCAHTDMYCFHVKLYFTFYTDGEIIKYGGISNLMHIQNRRIIRQRYLYISCLMSNFFYGNKVISLALRILAKPKMEKNRLREREAYSHNR